MSTKDFYTNQGECEGACLWESNQNDPIINRAATIKEVFNGIIKILVIVKSINLLYLLFDKYINPDCNFINKDIKTEISNNTNLDNLSGHQPSDHFEGVLDVVEIGSSTNFSLHELVLDKKDNESDNIVELPENLILNIETNIMIDNKEEQPNTIIDPIILPNPPIVCNDIHPIDLPGEGRDVIIIE